MAMHPIPSTVQHAMPSCPAAWALAAIEGHIQLYCHEGGAAMSALLIITAVSNCWILDGSVLLVGSIKGSYLTSLYD
eukprot:SAG31_NODE_229_length_19770_cov_9.887194_13_plen_77_part_00